MKTEQELQDLSATGQQQNNWDDRSGEEEKQDILTPDEQGDTPMIWYVGNFDRVCGPEDLEPRKGIQLNAPPEDARCMCCGRHLDELTPFGGPGDPLVGDFNGALLIKKYRRTGPYDEEAQEAVKEAQENCTSEDYEDVLKWLVEKHGKEKGERFEFSVEAYEQIGSSWECRNCAVLNTDEYFAKLEERYRSEEQTETRNNRKIG